MLLPPNSALLPLINYLPYPLPGQADAINVLLLLQHRKFLLISSQRLSLCHAAPFLLSRCPFLCLRFSAQENQNLCGVTLTSFLAPISHLMTQRQFPGSPSAFHVRKFPTQIGLCSALQRVVVTCCSPSHSRPASFVRLARTTTVQPHSLAGPGRTFKSSRN